MLNFVVGQTSARIRLIILTAYLMTTTSLSILVVIVVALLIAIALTSVCTGNFTCVHEKMVIFF